MEEGRLVYALNEVYLIAGILLLTMKSISTTDLTIPPRFLPTPQNITINQGQLAVLRCHVAHLGPKMVVWRKTNVDYPITIGKTVFAQEDEMSIDYEALSKTESRWDLLIKNVKPYHAGLYECQVSATDTLTHYVQLHVLERHTKGSPSLKVSGTEYVDEYRKIHLICNATGRERAPDDIDWFFEGNRIDTSKPKWTGRIEITKHRSIPNRSYISELIIRKSTMADQGNYVCRSSDLNVHSIKVHVLHADKENTKRDGNAPFVVNGKKPNGQSSIPKSSAATISNSILCYLVYVPFLSLVIR